MIRALIRLFDEIGSQHAVVPLEIVRSAYEHSDVDEELEMLDYIDFIVLRFLLQ